MIFVWIFLIPSAIIVARYYKELFPGIQVSGVNFWFAVHFPTMVFAFILIVISFLIILSGK
jgi:hypothetical protein